MLTDATLRTNKAEILQREYINLVNGGVSPDEILVLCLNSYKKQAFLSAVGEKITVNFSGKFNVQTFFGLCYNAISDNWVQIENSINFGKTSIMPNLCGLELSRNLLSRCIKKGTFEDYFSKTNLLHQLFKRMQLSVLNALSDKQIEERSDILKESFSKDAAKACSDFKALTLKYRSFDYLRQLSVLPYIVKNTDYFKKIKYLFVDDADEMTFAEVDFIRKIQPNLKDWYIAYDSNGASRCGYLSAYKTAVFEFPKMFGEKPERLAAEDFQSKNADTLYNNILMGKKSSFENFALNSYVARLDMLENAFEKIKTLCKNGVKPSEIVVITPIIDDMLKSFMNKDFNCQIISGSEKPKDTLFLRHCLTFLKLVNPDWGVKIETSDMRSFLSDALDIQVKYLQRLVNRCVETSELVEYEFENPDVQVKYDDLRGFINSLQNSDKPLSLLLLKFFEYFSENGIAKNDLKKFNFLLKEVRSFENAFGELSEIEKCNIVMQFENGIISENPSVPDELDDNALIVATPQKVIDFEIRRKYQIWLDVSADMWTMRDIGVLYNAWVFNAEWAGREFTFDDNVRLSREKTARVLRKIFLCADKNIYAYCSRYDSSGLENCGNLHNCFAIELTEEKPKEPWKIIPREDQKQVVEYRGGKAAVNAVPGAGKTTVLIALLIELLKNKTLPSEIFVVTYMESAATNIREKIKLAIPDLTELPNVSTIHGLALRIIKENNNYTKLGLPDNFEIVDDNTRQKMLRECISALFLEHDDYDDYEKGISAVKLSPNGIKPLKYLKNTIKFEQVFDLYEQKLRMAGVIDYDDMLRYAVKLIEENADICDYYTNLGRFVIEDEAQDSSELQQKLLLLLSSKHGNLLRIGDINQAITSSFTDSDPKSFKKFFEENQKMVMKSSQRSAVAVQKVANALIDYSKGNDLLQDSFFDSKLTPTGKNPISDKKPEFKMFETQAEERLYVLSKIREIIKSDSKKSIAVLLRNNYQINDWASFFSENGLSVAMRTDILEQKSVFKVIFAFLKFLQSPFSNDAVLHLMRAFKDCGIIPFSNSDFEYVKALKVPFSQTSGDDLPTENLARLWWELQFNSDIMCCSIDIAAVRVGLRYFSTKNEKSNTYLISTIIKRLLNVYKTTDSVIEKLEQISKKPAGFKFFEDENAENAFDVRLMTLHKSKGDEFDVVFIPELTEENYSLTESTITVKSTFSEKVRELRHGYKKRSLDEIKKEIAEETLRLLYVGFTRAKEELYVFCAEKYKRKTTKSILFDDFSEVNL